MSKTRANYQLYPSLTNATLKMGRKSLGKKAKKITDKELLTSICASVPDMINTLDFVVFAEEYYWRQEGGVTVFPESKDMVKKLLGSKFDAEHGAQAVLPFECFSLAMPKGFTVDGVELPSCLVLQGNYYQYNEIFRYPFCDYLGIPYPNVVYQEQMSEEGSYISLIYRDLKQEMMMVQTGITSSSLPAVLESESYEDYLGIMKDYTHLGGSGILSCHNKDDATVQYNLVRLIAALSAYHSATEGRLLQKGFPGFMGKPNLMGKKEDLPGNVHVLEATEALRRDSGSTTGSHYRTCHFRNLRDKRFYQGKHEHTPKGSRWVFVSDAVINERVEPYTQA